jgi:hypothetical protein
MRTLKISKAINIGPDLVLSKENVYTKVLNYKIALLICTGSTALSLTIEHAT